MNHGHSGWQGYLNSTIMLLEVIISHHYCSFQATYIFSASSGSFNPGPSLNIPRSGHSCTYISLNSLTKQPTIIVAGGSDAASQTSVEIINPLTYQWMVGPSLPEVGTMTNMVQHPDGGAILIANSGSIYYLANAAQGQWTRMAQKTKVAPNYSTSFLIPDSLASCN